MVLPLHKLVHLHPDNDIDDCDSDDDGSIRPEPTHSERVYRWLKPMFSQGKTKKGPMVEGHDTRSSHITGHTLGNAGAPIKKMRTLQRFHGGPNEDRMAYMEKHSAMTARQLAVSAEQVSIYLTSGTKFFLA
jgi:hypothetical protein